MATVATRESTRLNLQLRLDAAKSSDERNRLGQFATPPKLAADIVAAALTLIPASARIRFLDPGFGTGSFYSALLSAVPRARIELAEGFEIDPHYGTETVELWSGTGLDLHLADFTTTLPPAESARFNLVVCNPPYVRHHHIDRTRKIQLRDAVARHVGFELNGLSGLYCYFMTLSPAWMANNALGVWLIPSEFMDVKYGTKVKQFLTERVRLLRIHRFDPHDVQFEDAFVSSAVVFFENTLPSAGHSVEFSFGATVTKPSRTTTVTLEELSRVPKWTSLCRPGPPAVARNQGRTLAELFSIKRGVATGCNEFFVLSPNQVSMYELPTEFLKPILPSPRNLESDEVLAARNGEPRIANQRFLLDCDLPEDELRKKHPSLWSYLQRGIELGVDQRYICRHREPWYSQECRPPAPFLCTYMGRATRKSSVPFRFVLNHSKATAANVYLLLYPKPVLAAILDTDRKLRTAVWKGLSSITAEMLIGEGRVYGGGLHKLEPKELANVPAEIVLSVLPKEYWWLRQRELFVD